MRGWDKPMRLFDLQLFGINGVTTENFPTEIRDFYDRAALKKALPLITFRKWGQKRNLPKNSGKVIRFKRWGSMAPATTPLTEGVTPIGSKLDYVELTATVATYGDYIPITDSVMMMSIDSGLTEASEQLGEQEGETLDILMRNNLLAGSNVLYAGTSINERGNVATKITTGELNVILRTLALANCKKITKQVSATTNYNTTPIRAGYIAVVSPYATHDLQAIGEANGWIPVEKYAAGSAVMEGEVGAYKGIRFVETTNAMCFEGAGSSTTTGMKATGSKCDVFPMIVFGEEAYGEVPLAGQSHGIIIKVHGENDRSDTSDPLNQRGSAGWKAVWTSKILNDAWILRYEHTVSA